jgi:hypothetical protein
MLRLLVAGLADRRMEAAYSDASSASTPASAAEDVGSRPNLDRDIEAAVWDNDGWLADGVPRRLWGALRRR